MKINNNINFTGIYKIPLSEKNIKVIEEDFLPMYKYFKREGCDSFIGENPIKTLINERIDKLAEIAGGSKEWLMANAEVHNINTDVLDDKDIHIITTNKEIKRFNKFFSKRAINTLIFKIKNKFKKTEEPNTNKSLPTHLQSLEAIINLTKKANSDFKKYSEDRIIKVNDLDELLLKMLKEE